MKNIYCAVLGNEIIAIHKRKKVIKKFILDNIDKDLRIAKLNVKASKYESLYLVRLGSKYIPQYLQGTAEEISEERQADIRYVIEVIERERRYIDSDKEKKILKKAIKILKDNLQEDDPDVFLLHEEHQNREHVRDILAEDNYDYGEAKY